MDCRVAVVSGIKVLVGADGIEPLRTLVQVADNTGFVECVEGRANSTLISKIRVTDDLQVSASDQGRAGASERPNLGKALRAIAAGKQDQRDNSRGGDRRCRVHSHRDFESERRYEDSFSLIVDARVELSGPHQFLDC